MTTIPTEASVSITGTNDVVVPIAVGDVNGNILPGDVLDAGSGSVTVADGSICTALLSADQTNITVTGLNVNGSTTVTVNGTCDGITLTDFGGPLDVTTTTTEAAPATIVFSPPAA